jgi:hypothetical protein
MDNQSVAALVKAGSPLLADMLTGPNSELARAALGRALVGDDQASYQEIAAAISNTPDALLKVREAEEQFLSGLDSAGLALDQLATQVQAKRLDTLVQMETLAQRDRQSARQRQIDMHDSTNKWLAFAVTVGFFLVLTALIATKYVPAVKGAVYDQSFNAVLQTMLGVLGTAWVSIITFYFGSSIGSKEKTALLAEDVSANNSQVPAPGG